MENCWVTKNDFLGLSAVVFQLSCSSGFTLQVRHKADAQIFTGLFTSIRQPVIDYMLWHHDCVTLLDEQNNK
jgi:hypothetical protein